MGSALVRAGCAILAVAAAVAVAACAAGSAGPAATHTSVEPPQPGLDLSRSPAALTLPVTNLAVAPDGKVWYSTGDFAIHPAGGGLNRLSGKILSHLADPLGLASGQDLNVQALTVGLDGAVWIGAGCAVGRFDGRAWQAIVSDCESLQGNVINIGLASDGTAWIATGFDLARYADGTMQSFDRLANWVAVAPDGTLWVSGWEGRADTSFVLRYDGVQWSAYDTARLHHASPGGCRTWVGRIAVAPDGTVWGLVAGYEEWEGPRTNEGVASFDGQNWMFCPAPTPLTPTFASHLEIAPDGTLWMATDAGLSHFDGATWTMDTTSAGEITVLAFAPDGAMWVGKSDGRVTRHHPREAPLMSLGTPQPAMPAWPVGPVGPAPSTFPRILAP